MNINELDSFKLSDAVKFHNRLNPKIWGKDEHLLPEVRDKLMAIAANFQEFLGVKDLDVQDVTVSGSNAAYSYSPHSDLDLHLVVKFPSDDEVYQELFNAKKYQYNDEHNLAIGGVPVELYVQNADESPVSQGEYSVSRNQWIQVPRRKRARIDDTCVRAKVEDIDSRIHNAIKSGDADVMGKLWQKIRAMRQAGLDQHGEFGCENIVFKILRNKGCIRDLRDARNAAQDREMSLKEQDRPHRFQWGFAEGHQGRPYSSEDGVAPSTCMFLNEDDDETLVQKFIQDTAQRLGIERMPKIEIHHDDDWSENAHSFGMYVPDLHVLHVNMQNRHIMDILRTVAHELTHCRQHEIEQLGPDAGDTGSDVENEANAVAGIIMRDFADAHPELFDQKPVTESSGYIPTAAQADDPRFVMALTQDVRPGATGREANKLSLHTDSQGRPALLDPSARNLLREFTEFVAESQILDEVAMTPGALRDWAASPEAQGIQAGFEAELIFRDTQGDSDYNEPDYSYDPHCRSIDDILEFFEDGEHNSRYEVMRLRDQLRSDYQEYLDDMSHDSWLAVQDRRVADWVKDNYNPFDDARNEVEDQNPDLDPDSEEFRDLVEQTSEKMLDQMIEVALEDPANEYHEEALDDWREDYFSEDHEDEWLESAGISTMSDVLNTYNITWPIYESGGGSREPDEIGKSLEDATGMDVIVSGGYHTTKRQPNTWTIEPDGSLEPSSSDSAGLEVVSPPMPLDQALTQLANIQQWALDPDQGNAYTNKSTGLHMGVSLPSQDTSQIDYVKLILFMGDQYVLEKFERQANTYCRSSLAKLQEKITTGNLDPKTFLQQMRQGVESIASEDLRSGVGTDKYTSAHIKGSYIEFRSPGNDWLQQDLNTLTSTMLRFARAMQIAGDPLAYQQEYAKKLYKLLAPRDEKDPIALFAQYVAGDLPKAALKSFVKNIQLQRQATKPGQPEPSVSGRQTQDYIVSWTDQSGQLNQQRITARNSMMALDDVRNTLQHRGISASNISADPAPLAGSTQDLALQRSQATQHVTNPLWQEPQAQAAAQPQGQFTGRWLIRNTNTGQVVHTMSGIGNVQDDANRHALRWLRDNGDPGMHFEVVPDMGAPVSEGRDRYGNFDPPGPESPPKMPDGTIKVDVSDVYDWYKLGQGISDLSHFDKNSFGKGPPSTVLAFGSEDLENMYSNAIMNLGMKTHDLDEPGETDRPGSGRDIDEAASDYELHDRAKLDQVLKKCCRMVIQGQQRDPAKYGQVAACVIDPDNRQIFGINLPGPRGTRRHAERVAIDRYRREIGEIPQGSIIVTTCSPCNSPMDERAGESCKDLLNSVGIHKVYAGYEDPTQHDDSDADFRTYVTGDDDLWGQCQLFAQTFLNSEELITEGATSVLYHYTSVNAALNILQQGAFQLSSSMGTSVEQQYAPEGYNYFLSTSRVKSGDYARYVGSSGVMFVLDGNWLSQRYPVKPMDYWERAWLQSDGTRTRESEDRVFSREPEISIAPVKAMHVLIKEQHEYRSPQIRQLMILAKRQNIPSYLYTDESAWRLQDRRRAVTPKQAGALLRGQEPKRTTWPARTWLDRWLELIHKKNKSELSPEADKLRYNLQYYSADGDHQLGVDLGNARKPDAGDRYQAVKIIDYMRRNRLRTPADLVDAMRDKWKTTS